MTRALLALLLSVTLVHGFASAPAVQSADDVIEKHLEAIGGRAALAKLTSRRSIGRMAIYTPAGEMSGVVEISEKAPNMLRVQTKVDLSAVGMAEPMVVESVFDGFGGWASDLQGRHPLAEDELDEMRNNKFPTPLLDYKAAGSTAELRPREKVSGKSLMVVKLTPIRGTVVRMYFDPDTYLLVRRTTRVSGPGSGSSDQISEPSDYRDVGGVKVAFNYANTNFGQKSTVKLEKVEHNVPLDDALFAVKK